MKFNKNLFCKGYNVIIANEVKVGMIICLSKNRYFYVDDFDEEYINEEVSKLYDDCDEVAPEHIKITFYNEDDEEITDIPGTAHVIAYDRIDGNHNKNLDY